MLELLEYLLVVRTSLFLWVYLAQCTVYNQGITIIYLEFKFSSFRCYSRYCCSQFSGCYSHPSHSVCCWWFHRLWPIFLHKYHTKYESCLYNRMKKFRNICIWSTLSYLLTNERNRSDEQSFMFCVRQRLWAFNININWILMMLVLLLLCIENWTDGQLHAKST